MSPYIEGVARRDWEDAGLRLLARHFYPEMAAGDLNYLFTVLAHAYVDIKGEKYQHYNDVIGALECCKQELYRRKIAAYEDSKIQSNGDVK